METSNNKTVKQTIVSTSKTAGNAVLYGFEKPLIGVAGVLHTAAAVLTASERGIMAGAAALHAKRTGKTFDESKSAIYTPYDAAFEKASNIIEKNMDAMQAKYDALQAKRKAKALVKAAEQRAANIAAAEKLLAEVALERSEANVIVNSRLSASAN